LEILKRVEKVWMRSFGFAMRFGVAGIFDEVVDWVWYI
jgi:hypothetical protein